MKVLLTGATGFLGDFVRKELTERKISWSGISRDGTHGIKGDLRSWNLGIDPDVLRKEGVTVFLHMGALYDLRANASSLFATNVSGTLNALILARKLNIPNFINVSSVAAVANCPLPIAGEQELFLDRPFYDSYGESKALAEKMLVRWTGEFESTLNLRLGVLVGDTLEGKVSRVDGPYWIPEAFRKLKSWLQWSPFPVPLPGGSAKGAPLVPVDRAAFAIAESICKVSKFKGHTPIHVIPKNLVEIGELYKDSLNFLGLGHKKFFLVNELPLDLDSRAAEFFAKLPREEVKYLSDFPVFNRLNSSNFLPENWCPDYSEYKSAFWRGYEKFIQNR